MRRFIFAAGAIAVAALVVFHRPRSGVAPGPTLPPAAPRAAHSTPRHRSPAIVVYVSGAVARPGLYDLREGARANDAVSAAGGLRPDADASAVNLAARVNDGDQVDVPVPGAAPRSTRPARKRRGRASAKAAEHGSPVNVNDATPEELARVPGIGKVLAERIVALREQEGPFPDADALLDVSGMTPARLERAREYVLFYH